MAAAVQQHVGSANQARTPGRTTLLDAVNVLLEAIGEQPVNSLDSQQVGEAAMAERTVLEFHREGQVRGWSWNTEYRYPFTKDEVTGRIRVPDNVASWATDAYEWAGRFQLRGQDVYDLETRSTTMPTSIGQVEADVVWFLSWDQSPEAFNRWTTIRAARVFAGRALGSDQAFRFAAMDEQAALVELQRVEIQQAQPNAITGGRGLRPFPTFAPAHGLLGRNRGYLRG